MKNKLILFLKWIVIFLLCFALIFLIVFADGWKLFESNDPILTEIGVALVLSVFVFVFIETVSKLEKKVKSLEERLNKLENK